MTYGHTLAQDPRVMKFTILVNPSLLIITIYRYSVCLIIVWKKRRFLKELNAFSQYDFYGYALLAQEPLPWGLWNLKFGRPIHSHHYYILSLSDSCPGVEKKIFKDLHIFYTLSPKINTPWGGHHEIYKVLSPYLIHATYQIWKRLALKFLRRIC